MKLLAVGAMTAGLVGAGASPALAGDYHSSTKTKVVQCSNYQQASGFGFLFGVGANVNVLNSSSCSGSVTINR